MTRRRFDQSFNNWSSTPAVKSSFLGAPDQAGDSEKRRALGEAQEARRIFESRYSEIGDALDVKHGRAPLKAAKACDLTRSIEELEQDRSDLMVRLVGVDWNIKALTGRRS